MNKRRDLPLEAPAGATLTGPGEVFSHSQAAAGPAILITSLEGSMSSGSAWDKTALTELATKWREVRVGVRGGRGGRGGA